MIEPQTSKVVNLNEVCPTLPTSPSTSVTSSQFDYLHGCSCPNQGWGLAPDALTLILAALALLQGFNGNQLDLQAFHQSVSTLQCCGIPTTPALCIQIDRYTLLHLPAVQGLKQIMHCLLPDATLFMNITFLHANLRSGPCDNHRPSCT